ncbi:MAG: site-specific DNA-methyltransferase [Deltaproteobacteria bacterium]|nr:site-specific DNA-methyltransferase [Deltaproteobacteria bacterium]
MSLDTSTIPADVLDIRQKQRSNPLEWQGQFSPQLVEALLDAYASKGATVLDPFVGSGTVVLEAARRGLAGRGVEVNPAAYHLASFYRLINLSPEDRTTALSNLGETVRDLLPSAGPLFEGAEISATSRASVLVEAWHAARTAGSVPGLAEAYAALIVLTDIRNAEASADKMATAARHLEGLGRGLPKRLPAKRKVTVRRGDARQTGLRARSVDVVLTSPPYVNVFNYHQKYRGSVEAMGWDVLEAARSEIGANRKHRGNRVLTVIQYCIDMSDVLAELGRLLKDGGRAILVVGRESMVRKTAFFNAEMIAEIAARSGEFRLCSRQDRVFQNRFGQQIFEDILHLEPTPRTTTVEARHLEARKIAEQALKAALSDCPDESTADIRSALDSLEKVQPSPRTMVDE